MKMKKLWASLLCLMMVLVMALTMTACEKDKDDDEDEDEKESTSQTDKGNKKEDEDEKESTFQTGKGNKKEDKDEKESASQTDKGNKKENDKEESASIVGEWKADVNIAEMADLMGAEEEMVAVFEQMGLKTMTFYAEFKDNGKMTLWIDADAFLEDVKDGMKVIMEMAAEEYGMTLDELLEASGMTLDEAIEDAMAEVDTSELEELEETFYYELDGKTLLTGDSKDELEKEGTFDGKKIVLEKDGVEIVFKRA